MSEQPPEVPQVPDVVHSFRVEWGYRGGVRLVLRTLAGRTGAHIVEQYIEFAGVQHAQKMLDDLQVALHKGPPAAPSEVPPT